MTRNIQIERNLLPPQTRSEEYKIREQSKIKEWKEKIERYAAREKYRRTPKCIGTFFTIGKKY